MQNTCPSGIPRRQLEPHLSANKLSPDLLEVGPNPSWLEGLEELDEIFERIQKHSSYLILFVRMGSVRKGSDFSTLATNLLST